MRRSCGSIMKTDPPTTLFRDPHRAAANFEVIRATVGSHSFALLQPFLSPLIGTVADPDMALNNFERLATTVQFREKLPTLLAEDARRFSDLLHLLAASQFLADTLIADPDSLDTVLAPIGRNPSTAELKARLRAIIDTAADDAAMLHAFRRFRNRQMLRIGVHDILRDRPLEEITRDLCRVADACLEVAVQVALTKFTARFGTPLTRAGTVSRLTVLGFGKLGGDELNYSSDLDLMFVYDDDGNTHGERTSIANSDFFARTVGEMLRILGSHTDRGVAYRIDLRLRPEGAQGPLARSLASTLSYYDVMGRTWERQALIKLRHIAGDPTLGREFLHAIEPFVYRKYFSFSEINEVKALKRQMESRAARGGDESRDVKTGRGGIRDIEYTVQFLQLLNGGDLPAVRQRNTLLALEALEIAGCLTGNETYMLADAYRFLRKTEHRLQLMFDLQTHTLPAATEELQRLALRMGYVSRAPQRLAEPPTNGIGAQKRSPIDEVESTFDPDVLFVEPLDQFLVDLREKTRLDRTILDHLLHQSFAGEAKKGEPESDLILDPNPDEATIRDVLAKYGFRDLPRAYELLLQLARESVRFLSHRRCRHFLASIAPSLLRAVAEKPDPDDALANLERVTASLGAKAVLYEAFSTNRPSLKLYVDLCAGSPFLSSLLTSNPGMIDELLDSLVMDQRRSREELALELTELLRGATDPEPILHSFLDKEILRIGVGDLLGKSPVRATTAALSDLAETVLGAVVRLSGDAVSARYGDPQTAFALIALGKLGGRELNYHSDLDLLMMYEADGATPQTSHAHYFTELAQRVIRTLTTVGSMGRLYAVDMRLRPFGKSGSLVVPLSEFRRYFASDGEARVWERQALGRARLIVSSGAFSIVVERSLKEAMVAASWQNTQVAEIRAMRETLEHHAVPGSLKHGAGGLVDVEFLVQLLQLKYGRKHPGILVPNILDALAEMKACNLLAPGEAAALESRYTFLRAVEARLRIVTDRSLSELPHSPEDRDKLARRLGFEPKAGLSAGEQFQVEYQRITSDVRTLFDTITLREQV